MKIPKKIINRIKDSVGPNGWTEDAIEIERYVTEWRGMWRGHCDIVVKPSSTLETSKVIEICNNASIPVTPQGGNTGLVGAGVPNGGIVLSLDRLNQIREIDIDNNTIIVEAGCILEDIQVAAEESGRLFPLSLGAEGKCQIGGNISTNAGGVQVLRYGNARNLVLGLEAVLPDGRIWNGLRALHKDNTGYNLKHLFIGAEGTLGIITAAVLKLFPRHKNSGTALASMDSASKAVELFQLAETEAGDSLSSFELLNRASMELVIKHSKDLNQPFQDFHEWYALIDLNGSIRTDGIFETILLKALQDNIISDAVVAKSEAQASNLWKMREAVPICQSAIGASIKHDISIPISKVPRFLNHTKKIIENKIPGVKVIAFGHLGDGNIHFNLSQPESMGKNAFLAERQNLNHIVYEIVYGLGGSFSAEHGIGKLKRGEMIRYCSKTELDLMRKIKRNIDPNGTMNPQKVL